MWLLKIMAMGLRGRMDYIFNTFCRDFEDVLKVFVFKGHIRAQGQSFSGWLRIWDGVHVKKTPVPWIVGILFGIWMGKDPPCANDDFRKGKGRLASVIDDMVPDHFLGRQAIGISCFALQLDPGSLAPREWLQVWQLLGSIEPTNGLKAWRQDVAQGMSFQVGGTLPSGAMAFLPTIAPFEAMIFQEDSDMASRAYMFKRMPPKADWHYAVRSLHHFIIPYM